MSMMQTYKNITKRTGKNNEGVIKGEEFVLTHDCANDYYKEQLPVIPAGTTIIADFAGDFGMYGMVEVNGSIHKVKIVLSELHNIDFGEFDARALEAALSVPAQGAVKVTDAEFLAQYLHDECEWPEFDFPQHSWPDYPDDDGKRGDGYLKIVPKSSADEFRSLAQRILSALHSPAHSGERDARIEAAAKAVIASWDERGQEREKLVTSSVHGGEYWSPAASMVSSGTIAELRAALEQKP